MDLIIIVTIFVNKDHLKKAQEYIIIIKDITAS